MPVLDLYNMMGDKIGTEAADDSVFGLEPNKNVLHEVLVAELAEARQGTAATKTRAMVRGGGRKPFKQKGTGRARQGSIRAPHMVGGGVALGPQPRSYEKKVNKKVRLLAIKSALSEKVREGNIIVVDEFNIDSPKTKTMINFLTKVGANNKQMFILNDLASDKDWNTYLSARNLENAIVLQPNEIGVYWLLKQEKIIVTKEALKSIEEVLA
jgi:large subunit ribosomal protein L4